jgi:hypothetical protein
VETNIIKFKEAKTNQKRKAKKKVKTIEKIEVEMENLYDTILRIKDLIRSHSQEN